MFKWEVFYLYRELSMTAYCRYYLLSKPIDRNYKPPKIDDAQAAKAKEKGKEFIESTIYWTRDLHFSDDKLDQLVRCIRLLGIYKSWEDFAAKHNHYIEVTRAWFTDKKDVFSEIDSDDKLEINDDVRFRLAEKVYDFEYYYIKGATAFQVGHHRHIKRLSEDDFDELIKFCHSQGEPSSIKHISEALDFKKTWGVIDRESAFHGLISFMEMDFNLYRSLLAQKPRLSAAELRRREQSRRFVLICNLCYDSGLVRNDFTQKFNDMVHYELGTLDKERLFLCTFPNDYNDFMLQWGFNPDEEEDGHNGLHIVQYSELNIQDQNSNYWV